MWAYIENDLISFVDDLEVSITLIIDANIENVIWDYNIRHWSVISLLSRQLLSFIIIRKSDLTMLAVRCIPLGVTHQCLKDPRAEVIRHEEGVTFVSRDVQWIRMQRDIHASVLSVSAPSRRAKIMSGFVFPLGFRIMLIHLPLSANPPIENEIVNFYTM